VTKVSASDSDDAALSGLFGGLGGNSGAGGGLSGLFTGGAPSSSALASPSTSSKASGTKTGTIKDSTATAAIALKATSKAAAAAPLAAGTSPPGNAGKAGPSAPLEAPAPLSVAEKPAQGQLSHNEHKQLLELCQVWERRVSNQANAFGAFAKEALVLDDTLAEAAVHIQELHAEQVQLKAKAEVSDRSLQLIFDQQDALTRLMTGLTDSLGLQEPDQAANDGGSSSAADQRAQGLERQLEELHAQVRKLSKETVAFQTLHYSQPRERVAAVLGAHSHELDAMQQRLISAERRFAAVETRSRMAGIATSLVDGT